MILSVSAPSLLKFQFQIIVFCFRNRHSTHSTPHYQYSATWMSHITSQTFYYLKMLLVLSQNNLSCLDVNKSAENSQYFLSFSMFLAAGLNNVRKRTTTIVGPIQGACLCRHCTERVGVMVTTQ